MRKIHITGLMVILLTGSSCGNLYSKNEDQIKQEISLYEKQKGIRLKSLAIVDHQETGDSVVVYIKGIALPERAFRDTINFSSTGDGILNSN
jgi:hypothetical protein